MGWPVTITVGSHHGNPGPQGQRTQNVSTREYVNDTP